MPSRPAPQPDRPPRDDAVLEALEGGIRTTCAAMVTSNDRVVLAYSGGADSGLLLHLLQDFKQYLAVLWVNPGVLPHDAEHVRRQTKDWPHFVEIPSDKEAHWKANGLPARHVLPPKRVAATAGDLPMDGPPLWSESMCCQTVRWNPILNWCGSHGVGLIIHGQRRGEGTGLYRPGHVPALWGALATWSRAEVIQRIAHHGVTLPRQYAEGAPASLECAVCPADLEPGRMAFLRRNYPKEYRRSLKLAGDVRREAKGAMAKFEGEIAAARRAGTTSSSTQRAARLTPPASINSVQILEGAKS